MRRWSLTTTAMILAFATRPALGITLDDPANFELVGTWSGAALGVPGNLGAMMFSAGGEALYIVGNSESSNSAVYALSVLRDPATRRVTGFGMARLLFQGNPNTPGIDAGLEIGPEGTLFYTYWQSHVLGERTATSSTTEVAFDMTPTGVPRSVAGLAFSPHIRDPGTDFGQLQVSSWQGQNIYNVPLTPTGGGVFAPGTAELFVSLPQQGTGAIQYVPRGLFAGNMMYVNWNYGEVRMVVIDRASGLPIDDPTGLPTLGTTTPRDIRFAHDMGVGPWGLEFDPLTLDFFVTTWQGTPANSIIQFSGPGFMNRPPVAQSQSVTTPREVPITITLAATDADNDPLTFSVVDPPDHGTLGGTLPAAVYTPNAGYLGADRFTFRASDGRDVSATATVTISIVERQETDAGVDVRTDAGPGQDAGTTSDSGSGTIEVPDDEGCGCASADQRGAAARGALGTLVLSGLLLLRRARSSRRTRRTHRKHRID